MLHISDGHERLNLSMQGAEVGLAVDYTQRSFVLRLRVEGRQLLMSTGSQPAMMTWYTRLNEAMAISMPLESREDQAMHSLPIKRAFAYGPGWTERLLRKWRGRRTSIEVAGADGVDEEAIATIEDSHAVEQTCLEALSDTKSSGLPTSSEKRGEQSAENYSYAQRCATELNYGARWKTGWYYRDGEAVTIVPPWAVTNK